MTRTAREPSRHNPRVTPWVYRIMLLDAIILVLLQTVFTAPVFLDVLQFAPSLAAERPWTLVTSMFVHGGFLHLGGNLLLLFLFGPSVERRLGGRAFVLYYVYCGTGAALFALGLSSFMAIPPMLGASGAVLGTALAFAFAWPNADALLDPLPLRISARALVLLLATTNLVLAVWSQDGAAHLGFLGGLGAGYLWLRIASLLARQQRVEPKSLVRRPVLAPIPMREAGTATEVRPAPLRPEPRPQYSAEEVDRVLDKISAFGLQSLTAEERRFLDEASKRKRSDK